MFRRADSKIKNMPEEAYTEEYIDENTQFIADSLTYDEWYAIFEKGFEPSPIEQRLINSVEAKKKARQESLKENGIRYSQDDDSSDRNESKKEIVNNIIKQTCNEVRNNLKEELFDAEEKWTEEDIIMQAERDAEYERGQIALKAYKENLNKKKENDSSVLESGRANYNSFTRANLAEKY